MGAAEITLYVDTVSPFAYEAFHILRNDAAFRDVRKTYVPIFLGGLMKMAGNTPPIQIKNKDTWIGKERLLWARAFDIPMAAENPPNFPPNTLQVMRAVCGVADDQEKLCALLERFYHEFWVNHVQIAQPDAFIPIFKDVLGAEVGERVLAEAATKGKATLTKNTDRAFSTGAFGLPWLVCTNAKGETEGFWGVDHFGQVARFLDLPKPTPGNLGGWKSVL
ncbi:HCCA isomerase/glutathione S-transferase kappa [Hypoxylon argillaceum]|nr:HCCA isomerase/glutathione S-transferase kappa [Hypoxylon argillaceum]